MPSVKMLVALLGLLAFGGFCYVLHETKAELHQTQWVKDMKGENPQDFAQPQNVIKLLPGQKLVQYELTSTNHGIPDPGLSYLTRDMRPGEAPETYKLVRLQHYPIRNQLYPPPSVEDEVLIEEQPPIRAESTVPDPTRK